MILLLQIVNASRTLRSRNLRPIHSAYGIHKPKNAIRYQDNTNPFQTIQEENSQLEKATQLQINGPKNNRNQLLEDIFKQSTKANQFREAETQLQQQQQQHQHHQHHQHQPTTRHLPDMVPDPLADIRQRKMKTGSAYSMKKKMTKKNDLTVDVDVDVVQKNKNKNT